MVDLRSFEVWFLTGSQDLYGEAALKQVAEHSREIAAHLDGSGLLPVRVVWKPTLKSPEAILDLCREANAAAKCVGVITWMHTFSPAKMWIAGLSRLEKPLAHLHTQYNAELPWDTIDMDFMNLNQSAHGDREFGYIGARLRIERKVVVGHWKDEEVASKLDVWARAACAIIDARRLKIVRFGGMNMREVAVTGGDRVEAQVRLGWSVNGYGVGDLVARMAGGERRRDRRPRRGIRGEIRGRPRPAQGRPAPCRPALRRPPGGGHPRVPRGGRLWRLHHHLRGPARPRTRFPAWPVSA